MRISILIGSTRTGRMTPRAAKLVMNAFKTNTTNEITLIDLADLAIPFLTERLKYLTDPHPDIVRFSETIKNSDALVVVSPEYNGSAPGVLKNALDHLNEEYEGLPVGIATVSAGPFGGKSCYAMLHTLFSRLDANTIDYHLQITRIGDTLNEEGKDRAGIFASSVEEFVGRVMAAFQRW